MSRDVTIYIDESGSFETTTGELPFKPPWVVGGYYVIGERARQETAILSLFSQNLRAVTSGPAFSTLLRLASKELGVGSPQLANDADLRRDLAWVANLDVSQWPLHRTSLISVLRYLGQDGEIDRFVSLLDGVVFQTLEQLPFPSRPVVAVNFERHVAPDFANYATLLTECLTCLCSSLTSNELVSESTKLHFVIASRWSPDAQTTDCSVLGQDIESLRANLLNRITNDLVTLGAQDLLGPHRSFLEVTSATASPFLGIADMLCGHARRVLFTQPDVACK